VSGQQHAPTAVYPRERPGNPFVQDAGWAPGPVWTGGKSRPTGIRSPDRPARSSLAIPTELPGPRAERTVVELTGLTAVSASRSQQGLKC
jgi:hypothetical protein